MLIVNLTMVCENIHIFTEVLSHYPVIDNPINIIHVTLRNNFKEANLDITVRVRFLGIIQPFGGTIKLLSKYQMYSFYQICMYFMSFSSYFHDFSST